MRFYEGQEIDHQLNLLLNNGLTLEDNFVIDTPVVQFRDGRLITIVNGEVNVVDVGLGPAGPPEVTWGMVKSTPVTLEGYGITDGVATTDPRLSDARMPLTHAASHYSGIDALDLNSIAGTLDANKLFGAAELTTLVVDGLLKAGVVGVYDDPTDPVATVSFQGSAPRIVMAAAGAATADTQVGRVAAGVFGGLFGTILRADEMDAANLTGTLADGRLSANIPRLDANPNEYLGAQRVIRTGGGQAAISGRVAGDTVDRFVFTVAGELQMGLGAGPRTLFQRVNATATQLWLNGTYAADNLAVAAGNSATDFGGGAGVLAFKNATTIPAATPTGAYVAYCQAGALKGIGGSGTITTIGTADPHCPTCGRDFALEWESASEAGGHLAVCVWCLLEDIADALGKQSKSIISKSTIPRDSFPLPRSPWHKNAPEWSYGT